MDPDGTTVETEQYVEFDPSNWYEKSLKNQYQDASNISARINSSQSLSAEHAGMVSWIYEQLDLRSLAMKASGTWLR